MELLLADPDRDFLAAYQRLLTLSGYDTTTVFDSTQVVTHLNSKHYDIVILSKQLMRISVSELIAQCKQKGIPCIILSDHPISSHMLCQDPLGAAYLPFPFLPSELTELIRAILQKMQSKEKLRLDDIEIDPQRFLLCGKIPLTIDEIQLFEDLLQRNPIDQKNAAPYITALNEKLTLLGRKMQIRYMINDGYRLVKKNYE